MGHCSSVPLVLERFGGGGPGLSFPTLGSPNPRKVLLTKTETREVKTASQLLPNRLYLLVKTGYFLYENVMFIFALNS